jgi:DNA (cytosine-5)-methyltransferase 1
MQKIRFIDLFAGIGGIRLAFEQAAQLLALDSECVLSSEINPDAQLVYEKNFGHKPLGDIRLIDKLPGHEFLLAGFPCQSFSHAGKKEGFGDYLIHISQKLLFLKMSEDFIVMTKGKP